MADVEIGPEDIDTVVGHRHGGRARDCVHRPPYRLCQYCKSAWGNKALGACYARYYALMKVLGGHIMSRNGQLLGQLPNDIVKMIFGYGYHLALAVPTEFYRMQNLLAPTQRVFECEFSYVALCVPYNAIPSGAEVCDHVKWGWPGEQKERFRYMNSLSDSIWEWKRRAPTVRVVAMSHLGAQQYQQHLGQDALACVRA